MSGTNPVRVGLIGAGRIGSFHAEIDQPAETFGSPGAQLLLERIAGKAGSRSRRIVLQTDLLIRSPCGSKTGVPSRP